MRDRKMLGLLGWFISPERLAAVILALIGAAGGARSGLPWPVVLTIAVALAAVGLSATYHLRELLDQRARVRYVQKELIRVSDEGQRLKQPVSGVGEAAGWPEVRSWLTSLPPFIEGIFGPPERDAFEIQSTRDETTRFHQGYDPELEGRCKQLRALARRVISDPGLIQASRVRVWQIGRQQQREARG